jgi:hypothetical protein
MQLPEAAGIGIRQQDFPHKNYVGIMTLFYNNFNYGYITLLNTRVEN